MNIETIIKNEISLSIAQHLLKYGLKLAEDKNLSVAIAITDVSGNLVAFVRMDGAALVTIEVALGKAKTAAYIKAPSEVFENFINNGQTAMLSVQGLIPLQGGVPLLYKGEIIGAIGVSGADGATDASLAKQIAMGW